MLLRLALTVAAATAAMVSGCSLKEPKGAPTEDGKSVTIHVAPDGLDTNDGSLDRPVATLSAARDMLRTTDAHMERRIVVHGGVYWQASLDLGPQDSGLTIEAAPGETPVLCGGRRITDWRKQGESFYAATLEGTKEGVWDFRHLIVAGELAPRARLPREGAFEHETGFDAHYSPVELSYGREPGQADLTVMKYRKSDLGAWLDVNNAEITVFHFLEDSTLGVKGIDHEARLVTFSSPASAPIGSHRRRGVDRPGHYVVWNLREGMLQPGQWYLDRTRGMLVYWPRECEDMADLEVIAPASESIIRILGDEDRPVHDITIRGLAFTATTTRLGAAWWGAVRLKGAVDVVGLAYDCTFENLAFRNVGGMGLRASHMETNGYGAPKPDQPLRGIRVAGCTFVDCGGPGAVVWADQATLTNNLVRNVGRVDHGSFALAVRGDGFEVSHNEIAGCPYCGICATGWGRLGRGRGVTGPGVVEYNVIRNFMTKLNDGGAVYSTGRKITIRGNAAYGLGSSARAMARAYYLDEGARDCVIERNLAVNTHEPVNTHLAANVTVRDNVLIDEGPCAMVFNRSEGIVIERNVVVAGGDILIKARQGEPVGMPDNLFFSANGNVVLGTLPTDGYNLLRTCPLEMRQGSESADPMLTNPAKGDFSFRPGSPARRMGIKALDLSRVGRKTAP